MFAAHMDEVGFMVRHISDLGMLHLTVLGGVLDKSKHMQAVRVTCAERHQGARRAQREGLGFADGHVEEAYVDLGCESPRGRRGARRRRWATW